MEAGDVDFGKELSKGFVGKFLMAFIGFVGTLVFARALGPAIFGGFYLLLSLVKLLIQPINGLSEACKKRISETYADDGGIVTIGWVSVFVTSLIVTLLGIVFEKPLINYTGLPDSAYLGSFLFFTLSIFFMTQSYLSGRGKFGLVEWIDFLRSLLTFGLQLTFVVVLSSFIKGEVGMVLGLGVATLFSFVFSLYYLNVRPSTPSLETAKRVYKYSIFTSASYTASSMYNKLDLLLLGILFTPSISSGYVVSIRVTLAGVLIVKVMANGLLPRVSNLKSRGEDIIEDTQNVISYSTLLSIPLLFGAIVIGEKVIVTLYGPAYSKAGALLVWLALYQVFYSHAQVFTSLLNGIEEARKVAKISFGALLFNVIIGVILALELGPVGVVIATAVSEFLRYILLYYSTLTEIGITLHVITPFLGKQILASGLMAGTVWGLRTIQPISSWLYLLSFVGIGAMVYFGALLLLSQDFRETANRLFLNQVFENISN